MSKIRAYDGTMIEERDVIVEPTDQPVPHYDIRAMRKYAKSKGKEMADMTDEERIPFVLDYVNTSKRRNIS